MGASAAGAFGASRRLARKRAPRRPKARLATQTRPVDNHVDNQLPGSLTDRRTDVARPAGRTHWPRRRRSMRTPLLFQDIPQHLKVKESQNFLMTFKRVFPGSCPKRQKPLVPTPQAPIRNRQTRKVANAKGLHRNTNLT